MEKSNKELTLTTQSKRVWAVQQYTLYTLTGVLTIRSERWRELFER